MLKTKKLSALLLAITLLLALVPGAGVSAHHGGGREPGFGTGLIWDSWETIEANLREYPPSSAFESTLPSSACLKDTFPAPRNQGSQNSCVAWSVAYALKSNQEETKRGWGLHTDEHLFSPSYVYNQVDNGRNGGMTIPSAMNILVEQGVCTLASFPYTLDSRIQPTAAQREEAALYKVDDWFTIHGINNMKRRLADGDGIVIGVRIFPDFVSLSPSNPIYDVVSGVSVGNHAVTLIGYDNDMGESGAFKFINSWGTGWGLDGYGWISYELMRDERVNYYGVTIGYVMDAPVVWESYFDYTVSDGEATVTLYVGPGGDVVIPDSFGGVPVTAIGARSFIGKTLADVVIPDGVKTIGNSAFSGTRLTSVTIPESVITIGDSAFSSTRLTSVTIPSGITTINAGVFSGTGLTDVIIPDNVISIGIGAFNFCRSLVSVTIGSGVTSIGRWAFSDCTALTGITVNLDNLHYTSVDGVLFTKDRTTLIQYPLGRGIESYTIPASVTNIGDAAFSRAALTSINIPDSVITIGDSAFSGCLSLSDATIGSNVVSIGDAAFRDCRSLSSVSISNSVKTIGHYAFEGCFALTDIIIPASVTEIGDGAFHANTFGWRFPLDLTIHGYKGSYAQEYAEREGFPFVFITDTHECVYGEWGENTATCTAGGTETRRCTVPDCTEVETRNIDPLGHSWGAWIVTTPAATTAEGIRTRRCATCGTPQTENIPRLQKQNQNAPNRPVLVSRTHNTVTLRAVPGMEYRRGSGAWQDSPVFRNLKKNTSYNFQARRKQTVTHNASPASPARTVTTFRGVTARPAVPRSQTVRRNARITLSAPRNTTLYFTTNNRAPTTKSTRIRPNRTRTLTIRRNTTVRVIAVRSGFMPSGEVTRRYRVG